jgi:hypothetical protein
MLTFQPEHLTTDALLAMQRAIGHELAARNITGVGYRINPETLDKLRPAIEPGGLLHGGAEVRSADLRQDSRAWRNLIRELKTDPDSERCKLAHATLRELGVTYRDTGTCNGRMFYLSAF